MISRPVEGKRLNCENHITVVNLPGLVSNNCLIVATFPPLVKYKR